ncbi:UNVERIFIED_CONTAM: hypothetical protein HDU68_002936, partial [Siphonaria sp. JEL0065]
MTANRVAFEVEKELGQGDPLAAAARSQPKRVQEEMWSLLDEMEDSKITGPARFNVSASQTARAPVITQSDTWRGAIGGLDAAKLSFANRSDVLQQQILGPKKSQLT